MEVESERYLMKTPWKNMGMEKMKAEIKYFAINVPET
jgi:hypothetical protein